jgi:hypothetical protein
MAQEEIIAVPEELTDKVSLDDYKELAAAAYTIQDLSDLSKEEIEATLMGIRNPDDLEPEEKKELTAEELAKLNETPEQKTDREKIEKEAADKKALDDEAKTAGVTVEQLLANKAAEAASKGAVTTTDEVTDDDLLDFNPTVPSSEIKIEFKTPVEIQTKLSELDDKFDAGDITRAEYNTQRDDIRDTLTDARQAARDAEKEELIWKKEQIYFLTNRPMYSGDKGSDGKFTPTIKSKALLGALKESVSSLSKEPKYANVSGMELLIAADGAVKDAFEIKKETKVAVPEKKVDKKPAAALPDIQTLGEHVPAAADNATTSAFGELDALTGDAYEKALEKMPENLRRAYLDDTRRG